MNDAKIFITSAICPKCGEQLYTSDIAGYPLVCLECDENFFGFEIRKIVADYFEITVPVATVEIFQTILPEMKKYAHYTGAMCVEYDDLMNVMDIGYDDIPSEAVIKYLVEGIEELLSDKK